MLQTAPHNLTTYPHNASPRVHQSVHLMKSELIVSRQGEAPQFYKMDKTLLMIGREDTNDVPLNSQAISRNHARLEQKNGLWYVTDLNSTNGTFLGNERLPSNNTQLWKSGYPLQIGPYTLQWHTQKATNAEGKTIMLMPDEVEAAMGQALGSISDEELNVALNEEVLELREGGSRELKIGILSLSLLHKNLEISVEGLPTSWYTLSRPTVTVMPKKHVLIPLEFHLPTQLDKQGGRYNYEVVVRDVHSPELVTRSVGTLQIPVVHDYTLKIYASRVQNEGEVHLIIENIGNMDDEYVVELEPSEGIRIGQRVRDLTLSPSRSDLVHYEISAENRPLFGSKQQLPFQIHVSAASGELKQIESKMDVTPIISNTALLFFLVTTGLALFVFVLLPFLT